ncbi:hypothetical protein GCM10018793_30050 [Streptomyces sulfonofaciens]|uniref:N-acetyltransferase domain-containing protein n=1 Tax=Streptomyces sulfonofaciens TaxID=68272 RepID=A0A919G6Q9_9ACTN|nr:GNAT family N-acetyltransferase [Streptomyces sulfonofaciens]GHH78749.1 hypothetical protein GCM10018793_30050 [Streptomyces sulfonofaciens]
MIETRILTADDWRTWRELRLAALTEAPDAFGARLADWQGDGDREERWRARLAIPGSHNITAVLDGRPAGMVSGVPGPRGDTAELISLWVGPEARGRGVGDHLIQEVERWALRCGVGVLRLAVAPGNTHAGALYRRHGFAATDEPGDEMASGEREIIMVKYLTAEDRTARDVTAGDLSGGCAPPADSAGCAPRADPVPGG